MYTVKAEDFDAAAAPEKRKPVQFTVEVMNKVTTSASSSVLSINVMPEEPIVHVDKKGSK